MSLDLDKIRQRLEELKNNNRRGGNSDQWRPKPGKYTIRLLPWPKLNEGEVFRERWFYYNILPRGGIVAPYQFNEPDPVRELQVQCYEDGRDEMKDMAKQLYPRMRAYAPIVVRGEEDQGVKLWSFGKTVYEELLGFYLDDGLNQAPNAIADVEAGFDVDVELVMTQGRDNKYMQTKVNIPRSRKSSKLSDDPAQLKQWLESIPDIDKLYPCPSYDEVKGYLNDWLARIGSGTGSSVGHEASQAQPSANTSGVGQTASELDSLFDQLNGDSDE